MFFWPVVDIGNHGDQISNSRDRLLVTNQTEGHIPGGGGVERVRPNNVQFLKLSQDDMSLWPECTNCAGLCLLGMYS